MSATSKKFAFLKKRPILLLEVLIALALIALCALPLITPHIAMIKEQKKFASIIKLDNLVHHLYVDVLEQLQANKISWDAIEGRAAIPIDQRMLERIQADKSFSTIKGYFRFDEIKHKTNKASGWSAYLFKLSFHFEPIASIGKKEHVFDYTIYVLRHMPEEVNADNEKNPPKEIKNGKKSSK